MAKDSSGQPEEPVTEETPSPMPATTLPLSPKEADGAIPTIEGLEDTNHDEPGEPPSGSEPAPSLSDAESDTVEARAHPDHSDGQPTIGEAPPPPAPKSASMPKTGRRGLK